MKKIIRHYLICLWNRSKNAWTIMPSCTYSLWKIWGIVNLRKWETNGNIAGKLNDSRNYNLLVLFLHTYWRKWSATQKALDCWSNSPCQHLRKCIENSLENMHTDVRVWRVNSPRSVFVFFSCRFFFGKNKVMTIALGREKETEYKENLHKIANVSNNWML